MRVESVMVDQEAIFVITGFKKSDLTVNFQFFFNRICSYQNHSVGQMVLLFNDVEDLNVAVIPNLIYYLI